MDEKFYSGLLAKYARQHGGIKVNRNGGIRDGASGFYRGNGIDVSKVTDDMLSGEPFEFDWDTSDSNCRHNRIDFNDGFSIALKPSNLNPEKKEKSNRNFTGIGDTGDHDKSRGGFVGNGKYDVGPEYNGFSVSNRAGESQNYRNALKNNYDDIKYFDEHPERSDSRSGKENAKRNINQIHKWGKELLKNNNSMKLTEQQLAAFIKENVERVLNEIGYHEKQQRNISDDEYQSWLSKKSASKKAYYDSLRKEKESEKSNSKAVDYYKYKNGEHPAMKESIKMTESQFTDFIQESVRRAINEISYSSLDSASYKANYNSGEDALKAISELEDFLEYYVKSGSGQARELIFGLEKYRNFVERKNKQGENLESEREDLQSDLDSEVQNVVNQLFPGSDFDNLPEDKAKVVYSKLSKEAQDMIDRNYGPNLGY